ncbi:MAG: ribosome silencing factor [Planctomycetales bacterium]
MLVAAGVLIAKSSPDSQRKAQTEKSRSLASQAARVIQEFKGQDVKVLDLTSVTPIADFFVLGTGTSSRQMKAAAEEVHRLMKAAGSRRIGFEGEGANNWILQDYGDIVIHLFTAEARELYDLDHLWGDAVVVDWETSSKKSEAPAKKSEAPARKSETTVKKKAAPKLAVTEDDKPATPKKVTRKKATPRKKKSEEE